MQQLASVFISYWPKPFTWTKSKQWDGKHILPASRKRYQGTKKEKFL